MQFSDSKSQVVRDAAKIFDRGYDWLTGTEAGEAPVLPTFRAAAAEAGYKFFAYKSNFVAIKKKLIVPGSYERGGTTVVDNDETVGRGHDLNFVWGSFEHKDVGDITVIASHYALLGKPHAAPDKQVNLKENRELAHAIGDFADEAAKGRRLAFYGGDQNISDRLADTFFGGNLTSAWDELNKYEDTGHGNIDVIASHDKDKRVKAKYIRALDDSEFHLNTDHFLVEAGFTVELPDAA